MSLRKLMSMTDYVNQILDYVHESKNYERGIFLIKWYSELLAEPISFEMFRGEKPLFPNFKIEGSQKEAMLNHNNQSIHPFGEKEFAITLYRESEHSNSENGMCYITSYHMKKVEDLCDKDISFNMESEYVYDPLFDDYC